MTTYAMPMCMFCTRYRNAMTCDAYPDGIPAEIISSEHDHRQPYEGDGGMVFDPFDDESAEIVENMFADDDPEGA